MHDLKTIHHYNILRAVARHERFVSYASKQSGPLYRLAADDTCLEINRSITNLENLIMPAKKRAANTSYGITWIRVDLNATEKQAFVEWSKDPATDIGEAIARILIEGDKISMSYNEDRGYFYATVMGSDKSHRNAGKGFSSFAKDPDIALLMACFKYLEILEGDMSNGQSQDADEAFG